MNNELVELLQANGSMDIVRHLYSEENGATDLLAQLDDEHTQAIDQLAEAIATPQNPKDEIINFATGAILASAHICTMPGDEYKGITVSKGMNELELTPSEALDLYTNLGYALHALILETN